MNWPPTSPSSVATFGKIFVAQARVERVCEIVKAIGTPVIRGTRTSNGAHSRKYIAGTAGRDSVGAGSRAFKRHP